MAFGIHPYSQGSSSHLYSTFNAKKETPSENSIFSNAIKNISDFFSGSPVEQSSRFLKTGGLMIGGSLVTSFFLPVLPALAPFVGFSLGMGSSFVGVGTSYGILHLLEGK